MRRFLVLRGGAIGDFVVTLPVLEEIRKRFPRARVECLGYPRVTALALAAGLIDGAMSLETSDAARLFTPARCDTPAAWAGHLGGFDVILSYLHDPEGVVQANLARSCTGRVLVHSPIVTEAHAVDHLLKPLAGLGIPPSAGAAPCLRLPGALLADGREEAAKLGRELVFLHPGSGSPRKNWPLPRYVELAERLRDVGPYTPVFVLGEAEEGWEDALGRGPCVRIVRPPDLVTLAALLAAGRAYVGNDAGITHLAAAVGIPVVALFGATRPELWAPRGANVTILRPPGNGDTALQRLECGCVLERLNLNSAVRGG